MAMSVIATPFSSETRKVKADQRRSSQSLNHTVAKGSGQYWRTRRRKCRDWRFSRR
jgi:hypothetical protein